MSISTRKNCNGGYKLPLLLAAVGFSAVFTAAFTSCSGWDEGGGAILLDENLESIEITRAPERRLYAKPSEAQDIGGKSAEHWGQTTLDTAGLVVSAHYRDGVSQVVEGWELLSSLVDSSSYGEKSAQVSYTEEGVTKSASFSYFIVKISTQETLPDSDIANLVFKTPPSKSNWGFDEEITDWTGAVVLAYKTDNNETPYIRADNAGFTFSVGEAGNIPAQWLEPGQNRIVPSIKVKLTTAHAKNATFQNWAINVHNIKLVNGTTKYTTIPADSYVIGGFGYGGMPANTLWMESAGGAFRIDGTTKESAVNIDKLKAKSTGTVFVPAKQDGSGAVYTNAAYAVRGILELRGISTTAKNIYVLMNDISVSTWTPLNFAGWFYGQGHKLTHITTIGLDASIKPGFFSEISNARVEYLKLENINYTLTTANNFGGLAGRATNSYLDRIFVSGTINSAAITNSDSYLEGGGIIGLLSNSTLKRSMADVSITGKNSVGGIAGSMSSGSPLIQDCYSTGTVTATGAATPGWTMAAAFSPTINANGVVKRCFTQAVVVSDGGRAGGCNAAYAPSNGSGAAINNCVIASPSITTTASDSSFIRRVGTGSSAMRYNYTNNYALTYTKMTLTYNGFPYHPDTGDINGPDGLSKTEAELKTQSTYTDLGWDFTNVWEMGADGYPTLRWLGE